MNGHQLDRYRKRCRQKFRQVFRNQTYIKNKLNYSFMSTEQFYKIMDTDPGLNPWCVESHEKARKHRRRREPLSEERSA